MANLAGCLVRLKWCLGRCKIVQRRRFFSHETLYGCRHNVKTPHRWGGGGQIMVSEPVGLAMTLSPPPLGSAHTRSNVVARCVSLLCSCWLPQGSKCISVSWRLHGCGSVPQFDLIHLVNMSEGHLLKPTSF